MIMLVDNDNSGFYTFMLGVIVLVMFGMGLSALVNNQFKFPSGASEIRREIVTNATEIEEMRTRRDKNERVLMANIEIATRLETLRQRHASLEKSATEVRESIDSIEGGFRHYRADCRRKIWARAIGESLGTLTIHGGRVFQRVSIARVTEVGLEIRHECGTARIQAPDLDPKIQDRFQWNDTDRRSRLEEERKEHEASW